MTKGGKISNKSKENSTQLLVAIYLWQAFYEHAISPKTWK